jgi:hypothetical protein
MDLLTSAIFQSCLKTPVKVGQAKNPYTLKGLRTMFDSHDRTALPRSNNLVQIHHCDTQQKKVYLYLSMAPYRTRPQGLPILHTGNSTAYPVGSYAWIQMEI